MSLPESHTPERQTSDAGPIGGRLSMVVAMTPAGVIGKDGDMPWRLSTDLKRFKAMTMAGTLIMGRKTFESIGRPLPGRRTIVITRNPEWQFDGVDVVTNPADAIKLAAKDRTFVVGGAEIYRLLADSCDEILLTRVMADVDGDTTLELDIADFTVIESTKHAAGDRDDYPTEFVRLVRQKFLKK